MWRPPSKSITEREALISLELFKKYYLDFNSGLLRKKWCQWNQEVEKHGWKLVCSRIEQESFAYDTNPFTRLYNCRFANTLNTEWVMSLRLWEHHSVPCLMQRNWKLKSLLTCNTDSFPAIYNFYWKKKSAPTKRKDATDGEDCPQPINSRPKAVGWKWLDTFPALNWSCTKNVRMAPWHQTVRKNPMQDTCY